VKNLNEVFERIVAAFLSLEDELQQAMFGDIL
jgi:hypothetical protein